MCVHRWPKTLTYKPNWWESFETKDTKRCILAHFERCFWKLKMMRKCWKQGQYIVHPDAIRLFFSEVGTAENFLKSKTIYGIFCRYLKLCSWSWNCWENFKSKDAKWCILVLFETIFRKFELLRKFWKQGS